MTYFDSPAWTRHRAERLRGLIARERQEIARLRLGPTDEKDRRSIRAWRAAEVGLWILGVASLLVLALAAFTFFAIAMGGGIKG